MKIQEWVKIGEVTRSAGFWTSGLYARYAVMEFINANGWREYKEVFICSWTEACNVNLQ